MLKYGHGKSVITVADYRHRHALMTIFLGISTAMTLSDIEPPK